MPRLKHVPSFDGAFSYDGETYEMDDGVFVVDEKSVAQDIVEEHTKIRLIGTADVDETPTPDGDSSEDNEEICGAEMSDGSTCERPVDSCPYHD